MEPEAAAEGETEFEVEEILRYRRNEDGEEYFLVKWVGFSVEEATWEPLEHMNDNCRELIAKARALFAWRRPAATSVPLHADAPVMDGDNDEVMPSTDDQDDEVYDVPPDPLQVVSKPKQAAGLVPPSLHPATVLESLTITSEDEDEDVNAVAQAEKRKAENWKVASQEIAPAPAKRPKLQAPPLGPPGAPGSADASATLKGRPPQQPAGTSVQNNGVKQSRSPASTPKPPAPTRPVPTRRDLKCMCGASEQQVTCTGRGDFVECRLCNCALHVACVEASLGCKVPSSYVCPPCRVEKVDEFYPPVGQGLLNYSYAKDTSTLSLTFVAQATTWKKTAWAVHLRSVDLKSGELGGPAWLHRVTGKLNGRQCVAIDPPKHLHVRREQCYNLTPLLRQGVNTLELRCTPRPDKPRDEPEESYCIGVCLTRPRSVSSIITRIRSRSTETVSSGRERVARILKGVQQKQGDDDDCVVAGSFGKKLQPLCPMSFCPIEEAAIGRACTHVQVFDLQSYVAVNQRMRSLDKRWTCPVCSLSLRPDDIMLDRFTQGILDTMRGDEDSVEEVVFNDDCTWSTVSAEKDKAEEGLGAAEQAHNAVMIALSDSE